MPVEDFIPWIVGSVLLLFLGYLLNGWRERDFERRRTNYHAKLEHFREINEGAMRLVNALTYFRTLLRRTWEVKPGDFQSALWDMIGFAALARDEETPLGTQVVEKIMRDLKEASLHDDDEGRESALRDWLDATLVSLAYLWVRVLVYHITRLNKIGWDVLLVAETPVVVATVNGLIDHMLKELSQIDEAEPGAGEITVDQIEKFQKRLTPFLEALLNAMRHEIQLTLAGPIERRRKKIRMIGTAMKDATTP